MSPFAKKITLLALFILTTLNISQTQASVVYPQPLYNLRSRVEQEARSYLSSNSIFSEYTIPEKLKSEYRYKIEDIVEELANKGHVSNYDIKRRVQNKIGDFVNNTLKTIILDYNVSSKVDEIVPQVARQESVYISSMPSYMHPEFNRLKNNVRYRLKQIMYQDGKNYVRKHEIEQEIRKEMGSFFSSARGASWNSWWSSGSSHDSHYSGPGQTNDGSLIGSIVSGISSIFSTEDSKEVKSYELEGKVLDVAYDVLGLTPEKVPGRVVSDFSDTVKTITKLARNLGFITIGDIKRIAREQLQPIIDRINFKSETCTICLDGYSWRQRVRTLKCGHIFHENCINTWLNQKRTCPLCRDNVSYFDAPQVETVPW